MIWARTDLEEVLAVCLGELDGAYGRVDGAGVLC